MFRDSIFFKIKTNLEFFVFWTQKMIEFREGHQSNNSMESSNLIQNRSKYIFKSLCFFLSVCCCFSAINNIRKHDTYKPSKRP